MLVVVCVSGVVSATAVKRFFAPVAGSGEPTGWLSDESAEDARGMKE